MLQRFILIAAAFACMLNVAIAQDDDVLVGPLTFEQLLEIPGWFGEDIIRFRPDATHLNRIPQYIDDVEIVCVVGTWCSDSRREVPRMFRLMQIKNIAPEKMRVIGVDRDKLSPGGETAGLNIERVPTFIFYRDGKEIGRIIESPYASLEKDMLGIIMTDDGDNHDEEKEVVAPDAMQTPGSDTATQKKEGEGKLHQSPETKDRR